VLVGSIKGLYVKTVARDGKQNFLVEFSTGISRVIYIRALCFQFTLHCYSLSFTALYNITPTFGIRSLNNLQNDQPTVNFMCSYYVFPNKFYTKAIHCIS
jgi:hypothetical protein